MVINSHNTNKSLAISRLLAISGSCLNTVTNAHLSNISGAASSTLHRMRSTLQFKVGSVLGGSLHLHTHNVGLANRCSWRSTHAYNT